MACDSGIGYRRTILITGSTDGIGRQTAAELASRQKENFVIVHGRSAEKCRAAIEYIVKKSGLSNQENIDYAVADFSDLKQVVKLAADVQSRFPSLNTVICNAGVLEPRRVESLNGLEMTFQVNHVANFILVRKLLDTLKKNKPSRIILVSSICYDWHSLDWNDMQLKKGYEKYVQYSRSKLMLHMFGLRLARIVEGSGVTCNILEPGVIETKLLRNGGYSGAPVEQGSKASVFLAESPSVENTNGGYFDHNGSKIQFLSKDSTDVKQQERLWEETEKLCEKFSIFFE
ncbi:hypothetical protein AB6A40_004189 [Gnathostoma spinigerum]|uniref:Retinol dehydrogenase 14 n=1 Tax=Gnathostoma spinigerum TaxID=75299 RepID=A0ABD6EBR5_9BILA